MTSMPPATPRRWQFRPPLWAWLGLLPLLALLLTLGTWQLQRGQQKLALQATLDGALTRPAEPLHRDDPAPAEQGGRHVTAQGRYLDARQLLLDNEGHEGRPGYHVLTPLQLDDGTLVLVNRGWVPQDGDRRRLPTVEVGGEPRRVDGLWRPLPTPGLRLAVDNCGGTGWPRVVQYPQAADLRCLLGDAVLPGVLLLSPQAADGYVRDWRVSAGFPPERHYAYAAQWYAFAATLLFLFVKLNLKKIPGRPSS